MAATKSEVEYNVRKKDKVSDSSAKRVQKHKISDFCEQVKKNQTRAKTRTGASDDGNQSYLTKVREKGKTNSECVIEDASLYKKKDFTAENQALANKKEMTLSIKKDSFPTASLKKDVGGPVKKELIPVTSRKENENGDQRKKEMAGLIIPKKEVEVLTFKSRKSKLKVFNVNERKCEESKIKDDKIKQENGTFKESTSKENDTLKCIEKSEIMNSDISSSVDVPKKNINTFSSSTWQNGKDGVWQLGDIVWGRVGQHPFWPCIIAIDSETGQYSRTRRVGRGSNSVQLSLHVQFFGDKGRHCWIPSTYLMKYQGKELFEKFANNVLKEMKRKDKMLSAFIVKPTSRQRWEIAIREADQSLPKTRDDRLVYFRELLPKKGKAMKKSGIISKDSSEVNSALSPKKVKRPSPSNEGKPSKLIKTDRGQVPSKIQIDDETKADNVSANAHSKKKGEKNKQIGESDVTGESSPSNLPRVGLFLRRNIRKMLKQ